MEFDFLEPIDTEILELVQGVDFSTVGGVRWFSYKDQFHLNKINIAVMGF
jgi:hypothetical protein